MRAFLGTAQRGRQRDVLNNLVNHPGREGPLHVGPLRQAIIIHVRTIHVGAPKVGNPVGT